MSAVHAAFASPVDEYLPIGEATGTDSEEDGHLLMFPVLGEESDLVDVQVCLSKELRQRVFDRSICHHSDVINEQ